MFKFLFLIPCILYSVNSIAATNQCKQLYTGRNINKLIMSIEETLYIGIPVAVKPFSANGNKNSLWLVTLKNPKSNQEVTALFKPRYPGDGDGWNRVTMEYASYEVSKLLGLQNIPPVAYRYNLTLNGKFFYEGSMQYFVKGATLLKTVAQKDWNVDPDYFISDARILDILLQNPDRHAGNFIFGPHWVDGVNRPFLIDQAANLRKGTDMRLSTKGPFNEDRINKFNPQTVGKLRELTAKRLMVTFPFMTKQEIMKVLHHRDGLLRFIDKSL